MNKAIGFTQNIKKEWLDKAVILYLNDKDNAKNNLKEYIYALNLAEDNKKKNLKILEKIWYDVPDNIKKIRNEALNYFNLNSLAVHWGMTMLAYPFFTDIVTIIGKLFDVQYEITLSLIKNRIIDIYGERQTVIYAINRVIPSISDWGAFKKIKTGVYSMQDKIFIENINLKAWLLKAYMLAVDRSYINYFEIKNINTLFPFDMNIGLDYFISTDDFHINIINDEEYISFDL